MRVFSFIHMINKPQAGSNIFFSRPGLTPCFALLFFIGSLRVFHRFLLIPSSLSFGDILLAKDEGLPLFNSFCLVLGCIGKGCGDTFLRDFSPPSCLHELDFMISYDITTAITHVLFVLDLSLF
jgi:hypothetical protein